MTSYGQIQLALLICLTSPQPPQLKHGQAAGRQHGRAPHLELECMLLIARISTQTTCRFEIAATLPDRWLGECTPRPNKMRLQETRNLTALLGCLSGKKQLPVKIYSTIKVIITGKLQSEILVDQWPHPKAVIIKAHHGQFHHYLSNKQDKGTYEHLLLEHANEYSIYAEDSISLLPLIAQFDWNNKIVFPDIKLNSAAYRSIKEYVLSNFGGQCWKETEPMMTYIQKDIREREPVVLPVELSLRELRTSDAGYINSVWAHGGSDYSRHFITSLIQHLPGCGVAERGSGRLVACVLTSSDLSLGVTARRTSTHSKLRVIGHKRGPLCCAAIGYVREGYRRMGLAQGLIHEVAAEVRREFGVGTTIYGHVLIGNAAMRSLMNKVNFTYQKASLAVWATYTPAGNLNQDCDTQQL